MKFARGVPFATTAVVLSLAIFAPVAAAQRASSLVRAPEITAKLSLATLESDIAKSAATQVAPNLNTTIPSVTVMSQLGYFGVKSSDFSRCFASIFPSRAASTCVWGDSTSTKTLLLLGDSQAAQWLPALNQLGIDESIKVVFVAHPGCVPFAFLEPIVAGSASSECRTFAQDEVNLAKSMKPNVIIPITADFLSNEYPDPQRVDWYERLIEQFKVLKSHVVMFGTTPWVYILTGTGPVFPDPTACISVNTTSLFDCDPTTSANPGLMTRIVAAAEGVTYFDVNPLFCAAKRCPLVVRDSSGNHLVLFNATHVSNSYLTWIVPAFESLVKYALVPGSDSHQAAVVIKGSSSQTATSGSITLDTSGGSGAGLVTYLAQGTGCVVSFSTVTAPSGSTCTVTAYKSASGPYAIASSKPVLIRFP